MIWAIDARDDASFPAALTAGIPHPYHFQGIVLQSYYFHLSFSKLTDRKLDRNKLKNSGISFMISALESPAQPDLFTGEGK